MIRRYRKIVSAAPIEPLRVHTVRLLNGEKELQAAVERARAFERRGSNDYQRRVGTYDRLLNGVHDHPANVAAQVSSRQVAVEEKESGGVLHDDEVQRGPSPLGGPRGRWTERPQHADLVDWTLSAG